MHKLKILLISLLLVSTQLAARTDQNPFSKTFDINIGASAAWKYQGSTATKSAKTAKDQDTYYHLTFDGRVLRLVFGEASKNDITKVKHFEQLAIDDVQIDGVRLPLFQWCLNHQEGHSRFLQQDLVVEKNICMNQGGNGSFTMMLNQDSLDMLEAGKTLSFFVKPFRTTVVINYTLADFSGMVAKLANSAVPTAAVTSSAASVTKKVLRVCQVKPPAGYEIIKPVEYPCDSVSDETNANKKMISLVGIAREQQKKDAAEKARKLQAELAAKKKAEQDKLLLEQKKQEEAAVLAASKLKRQELNSEITQKMLGVCSKMWEKGEHRCYCQKYIDNAPAEIRANSKC